MNFYVFGTQNQRVILLIHGVQTPWQVWTPQIEHFSKKYCVLVPALDGHEEERQSEFVSISKEAEQIEAYCLEHQYPKIFAVCGMSMGGAIGFQLWENEKWIFSIWYWMGPRWFLRENCLLL